MVQENVGVIVQAVRNILRILVIKSAGRLDMSQATDVDLVVILENTVDQKKALQSVLMSRKGGP